MVEPAQKTTSVKAPMLSLSKQIRVQSLLANATFFDSQMKKNLSETITAKLYPLKECEKKHKEQCIND